ncbi:MAG: sigma-70 family RNA polymerase sigma factor [Flavobacteriaceae bacterium]|nr:sigma-70 family RNA polymerase sigma factor [Flavobacteriaceae bacterium]
MGQDQLIIQFQQKNTKAFHSLYNMYCDSILGVIHNIVRNDDLSQEVMQDVFLKVWNNAESYSASKGRFFTWVLNIARNAAIDKVRSKSFKNAQKNLDAQIFVDILEDHDHFDSKSNVIGIKKIVNTLAEKCKSIIDLLYFKGYTQKEVSETLDMPIGTVKTRNRNCIGQLRKMLTK